MFAAIGRFSYRHRWILLGLWVLAFGAGLSAATRLPHELKGGGFTDNKAPGRAGAVRAAAAPAPRAVDAGHRVHRRRRGGAQPGLPGAHGAGPGRPDAGHRARPSGGADLRRHRRPRAHLPRRARSLGRARVHHRQRPRAERTGRHPCPAAARRACAPTSRASPPCTRPSAISPPATCARPSPTPCLSRSSCWCWCSAASWPPPCRSSAAPSPCRSRWAQCSSSRRTTTSPSSS